MIGAILYHGLCELFVRTKHTENVLLTIERISQFVYWAIYISLMVYFIKDMRIVLFITCVWSVETVALCILPIPRSSAAYKLRQLDMKARGFTLDSDGRLRTSSSNAQGVESLS